MLDITRFVAGLHDYIGQAFAPVVARLKALEERAPPKDGADGKSLTPEDVRPLVEELVAAIPHPKDGADGRSLTPEDVRPLVEELVAAIPHPKDGADGRSLTPEDVRPLVEELVAAIPHPKDGADGRGVTVAEVIAALQPTIDEALGSIPTPRDGVDGRSLTPEDVRPLVEELVAAIPRPKDGADGQSVSVDDVKLMLEGFVAKWALDFERRAMDLLQRVADKIPLPKDGKDGMGFDDFEPVYDGHRTLGFRMTRGEQVKEWTFKMPWPLEIGVYQPEHAYERGDGVTYAGSFWFAQTDTTKRPGDNNSDWRLAVKKGRDGKDGKAPEITKPAVVRLTSHQSGEPA
jgi:hypothetical protein